MTPTIIFDFDGTLALGNGPITAFARAIADRMADAGFAGRAAAALARLESGEIEYRDGYDAVTRTATAEGVTADVLSSAYAASRALLGSDDAAVMPPAGLAAFLERVGRHARLELATNAPSAGVIAVLTTWGVADAFDAMHFTVGKPAGLVPVLSAALDRGPALAVGDIFEFDLAPAVELGADTALVGVTAGRSASVVTMRGTTLSDLYDEITSWVRSTAFSSASSSARPHSTERQ